MAAWCANLHGEVSELWEAYRRGKLDAPCDKEGCQLTCAEEEVADIFIRNLDTAKQLGIHDVERVIRIKHEYNRQRPFLHGNKKA
jgi:hypothetical protein